MPDELSAGSPSGTRTHQLIDLLDGLCEFARELPGWLDPNGAPRSWPLYVYGMAHIRRARLRAMLDSAEAVRAGRSVEGFEPWQDSLHRQERRD